eukprot:TRINITY_DN1592_c1_g1_i5.p1 TRINITY_DN1592_c1_g1~~TRINITY_DN1592_c1_g1_i5.p1  ORF type:complete len:475 (+),score=75.30 TRINITY_DN1592_c1_g1_i5:437-1861(+)
MTATVQQFSSPRQTTRRRSVRNPMETLSNGEVAERTEETKTHKENSLYVKEGEGDSSPRSRGFIYNKANGGSQDLYRANDQIVRKEDKVSIRTKSPLKSSVHKKATRLGWLAWLAWVARVIVKWTILLLVLFGIGRVIYSMVSHSTARDMLSSSELASEEHVAEVEGLVKKTSRMLQVQLELVDMKYAKELEGVKKELEEKIQAHASEFLVGLDNLKKHTSSMEEALKQLKDGGILTRNDVKDIVNEMSNTKVIGESQVLSLDDIRTVAKQLIEEELELHSSDGLGVVDFALKSGGSKVVRHSEGYNYGQNFGSSFSTMFVRNGALHPHASKMLEPSFGEPGQCLPLKGSRVFVDIALRTSIFVNAVTLEHVAKSVAYDRSSAPKDFRIFGWLSQPKKDQNSEGEHQMFLLGEFTYDLDKKNVQTFTLPSQSTGKLVNMIKLDVLSNHGSPSHTCIYRLRVHGSEPQGRPALME